MTRNHVDVANSGSGDNGTPSLEIKHIRLPQLKREPPLTFELIILLHVVLFNGLQFLHLYRTVWWLPQSFTTTGMNFHLIDPNLIIFTVTLTCRRIPYLLLKQILPSSESLKQLLQVGMTCWTGTWLFMTTIRIMNQQTYGIVHVIYLFWMIPVYFHVFGLSLDSLWDVDLIDDPKTEGYQYHHVCSDDPERIRRECEMLRGKFNVRLKRTLLLSLFLAYYSCFIPWCFVQPYVSYDLWWVTQHLILCWMYFFSLLFSRAFCPDFSDGLHKASCHLGRWARLRPTHIPSHQWQPEILFPSGSIVKYQRELFKAEGFTSAEPGNPIHSRFQALFATSTFPRVLLGFQLALQCLTLIILLATTEWYQLISLAVLLIASSHTFIRLSRDFLVVWKLYQAEAIILGL